MEKNQKILLAIIGILLIVVSVIGYLAYEKQKETPKVKVSKFKEEYEKLNGTIDDEGYTYPTVDIDVNYEVKYIDEKEVLNILDGNGLIYFGKPTSFECRNLVNSLISAADSVGISKIYYYDTTNFTEESPEYVNILEKIDVLLDKEEIVNDEGEKVGTVSKKLVIPSIALVKDGEIVDYHVGTIDKENKREEFTKEEKEELFTILTGKFIKISDASCNENTRC